MTVRIHKIHWSGKYTKSGDDLDFTITDVNCFVQKVSHPCVKWAIDEAWYRVSMWLEKKGAIITLGEPEEIEEPKK